MWLWIDCEWSDFKGELISMACVTGDGREWYQELSFDDESCCLWVMSNVVPHLGPHEARLSLKEFSDSLGSFLRTLGPAVEVISDWPEDIARFCDSLVPEPGRRQSTPALTFRIIDGDGVQSAVLHHALHDARALRDFHLKR